MKELMEILNPPPQIIAFTLKFVQPGLACLQTSYFYETREPPVFSVICSFLKIIRTAGVIFVKMIW